MKAVFQFVFLLIQLLPTAYKAWQEFQKMREGVTPTTKRRELAGALKEGMITAVQNRDTSQLEALNAQLAAVQEAPPPASATTPPATAAAAATETAAEPDKGATPNDSSNKPS